MKRSLRTFLKCLLSILYQKFGTSRYKKQEVVQFESTLSALTQDGRLRRRRETDLPSLPFQAAAIVTRRYVQDVLHDGTKQPDRFVVELLIFAFASYTGCRPRVLGFLRKEWTTPDKAVPLLRDVRVWLENGRKMENVRMRWTVRRDKWMPDEQIRSHNIRPYQRPEYSWMCPINIFFVFLLRTGQVLYQPAQRPCKTASELLEMMDTRRDKTLQYIRPDAFLVPAPPSTKIRQLQHEYAPALSEGVAASITSICRIGGFLDAQSGITGYAPRRGVARDCLKMPEYSQGTTAMHSKMLGHGHKSREKELTCHYAGAGTEAIGWHREKAVQRQQTEVSAQDVPEDPFALTAPTDVAIAKLLTNEPFSTRDKMFLNEAKNIIRKTRLSSDNSGPQFDRKIVREAGIEAAKTLHGELRASELGSGAAFQGEEYTHIRNLAKRMGVTRFEEKSWEELLSTHGEEEEADNDDSLSDHVSPADDEGDGNIDPALLLCNIGSGAAFGEEACKDELPDDLDMEQVNSTLSPEERELFDSAEQCDPALPQEQARTTAVLAQQYLDGPQGDRRLTLCGAELVDFLAAYNEFKRPHGEREANPPYEVSVDQLLSRHPPTWKVFHCPWVEGCSKKSTKTRYFMQTHGPHDIVGPEPVVRFQKQFNTVQHLGAGEMEKILKRVPRHALLNGLVLPRAATVLDTVQAKEQSAGEVVQSGGREPPVRHSEAELFLVDLHSAPFAGLFYFGPPVFCTDCAEVVWLVTAESLRDHSSRHNQQGRKFPLATKQDLEQALQRGSNPLPIAPGPEAQTHQSDQYTLELREEYNSKLQCNELRVDGKQCHFACELSSELVTHLAREHPLIVADTEYVQSRLVHELVSATAAASTIEPPSTALVCPYNGKFIAKCPYPGCWKWVRSHGDIGSARLTARHHLVLSHGRSPQQVADIVEHGMQSDEVLAGGYDFTLPSVQCPQCPKKMSFNLQYASRKASTAFFTHLQKEHKGWTKANADAEAVKQYDAFVASLG